MSSGHPRHLMTHQYRSGQGPGRPPGPAPHFGSPTGYGPPPPGGTHAAEYPYSSPSAHPYAPGVAVWPGYGPPQPTGYGAPRTLPHPHPPGQGGSAAQQAASRPQVMQGTYAQAAAPPGSQYVHPPPAPSQQLASPPFPHATRQPPPPGMPPQASYGPQGGVQAVRPLLYSLPSHHAPAGWPQPPTPHVQPVQQQQQRQQYHQSPPFHSPAGPRPPHGRGGGGARVADGGRGGGAGPRPQAAERPAKRSRKEREFDAEAAAAATAPVAVRAPASEAERRDVEQWKEERRKQFPTAANLARKAAEAAARHVSGALDPVRQQRLARLKEVVELQRSLGVDHVAGTTDLFTGSEPGPGAARGEGGADAAGPGPAGAAPDEARQVAGGVATKYQWVRNGYTPPVKGSAPVGAAAAETAGPHAGGDGAGGTTSTPPGMQARAAGTRPTAVQPRPQPQPPQWVPRPRRPSLLRKLLEKDVRRDHSWLLQAIRFFVRNRFLQPSPAEYEGYPDGEADGGRGQVMAVGNGAALSAIDWPPEAPEPLPLAAVLPPVIDSGGEEEEEEKGGHRPGQVDAYLPTPVARIATATAAGSDCGPTQRAEEQLNGCGGELDEAQGSAGGGEDFISLDVGAQAFGDVSEEQRADD